MSQQRQIRKFDAVFLENLPEMSPETMQWWIQHPRELRQLLAGFCLGVWKTIKLGTGFKAAYDFRTTIVEKGMKVSDLAGDILSRPAFRAAGEGMEVDLIKVTVAELGLECVRGKQIYARARELGLDLCPAEVGPQLRLQYKDQPDGECLVVGMEPILGSVAALSVFSVGRHGSELRLHVHCGSPDTPWNSLTQWVFVRPRK